MSTNYVILKSMHVGNVSAETDDAFLFTCFEENEAMAEVTDTNSPKMLLLGGTGCGKSAILRVLQRKHPNSSEFQLQDMAMNYIANSDALRFLDSLDVPLDYFFQSLWRHVICLEFIRSTFRVGDEEESQFTWVKICEIFSRDKKKRRALDYLANWQNKFFITMDLAVRELTEKLEEDVEADLGAEFKKFKARAGYARSLGAEKKEQLRQRAKKFVEAELLSDLSHVEILLSEYRSQSQYRHYIVIDQLDENWVDARLRYRLIRALIEALKTLRKIRNLKVVVAMRFDLLEKVIDETKDAGFQSEKYEDYFIPIRWEKEQLRSLIEKRVSAMYRFRYTKDSVSFSDVFVGQVYGDDPFDYIFERTARRPRELISFVNIALDLAAGQTELNQNKVVAAEKIYSDKRRIALIEEWTSLIPSVKYCFEVLRGKKAQFSIGDVRGDACWGDLFQSIASQSNCESDELYSIFSQYSGGEERTRVMALVFARLHLTGAVALKIRNTESYNWYYSTNNSISPHLIDDETRVKISPMFHATLGTPIGRRTKFAAA